MDEPASDRISGNVVMLLVVLVIAVVALVIAGVLMTRDSESVTTGGTGTTAGTPPGTTPGTPPASSCNSETPVPRPVDADPEALSPQLQAALVGCTETDVTSRARAAGWTIRVVERDGEAFAVTMDYQPSRLNLTIASGVVTEVAPG